MEKDLKSIVESALEFPDVEIISVKTVPWRTENLIQVYMRCDRGADRTGFPGEGYHTILDKNIERVIHAARKIAVCELNHKINHL